MGYFLGEIVLQKSVLYQLGSFVRDRMLRIFFSYCAVGFSMYVIVKNFKCSVLCV